MPTVLITGGHGGVGFSAVKHLASQARANIVFAGRSRARMESVAQQIRNDYGVQTSLLHLDTSSLASVRKAAAECIAMLESGVIDGLDAILCNAGGRFGDVQYSDDGYELTFATNVLGHFLLVERLLGHLAPQGRIVFTASGTHDPDSADGKLVGRALEPDAVALANQGKNGEKPASSGKRYATSKLCMIMLAYELDRRLRLNGSLMESIAYDPGSVPGTDLGREFPQIVQAIANSTFGIWLTKKLGVTQGSLEFSGEALAKLAVNPAYADASGKYYQSSDGRLLQQRSSTVSYDEKRAAKLWDDLRTLSGL